jgi:NitT/TauT family transport system ATP-binding protein
VLLSSDANANLGAVEVAFERVSYSYDTGVKALEDVTVAIPKGRSIGVIGPSGCGKTTLLYLLAGIYAPSEGAIAWETDDSQRGRRRGRDPRLSMVFQKDTLLPWRTVTGNIELFATYNRGINRQALRERTRELIELASLHGFEDAYPNQLSGGMRRRVQFLAAVAPSPKVLLLDEPFSALDEPTRIRIHQDVFEILRVLGTTMIIATHDLAETISLCDEVIILSSRPGRIHSRHVIPFGEERNMMELRQTPEFLEIYATLWEQLRGQIERAPKGLA